MNEYFLHFIWQFQYFNKQELKNNQGEELIVVRPGFRNTDQGPDFSQSHIIMGNMEWHGNIEVHIKASDWFLHKHQKDKNYDSIILHVVWENDVQIERVDGSGIPVLELKNRVDLSFIDKYRIFINSGIQLPCQYYLKNIPVAYLANMFDKALAERLERKGRYILSIYSAHKNNWEEVFWLVLFSNFGFKINNEAFAQLSRAISYKILLKHSNDPIQLEALLFGQAGFLEKAKEDAYTVKLKNEYAFLAYKYSLSGKRMDEHVWKFLRTRPYNFPTIRIAQLASLLKHSDQLINIIYGKKNIQEYINLLKTPVSPYWREHYRFNEKMKGMVPGITETAIYNIIVNVVIPFKTARYLAGLGSGFPEDVYSLLEKIPAEQNKVFREWKKVGVEMKTAYDSQAGIELYNQYCLKRKCLYCTIGNYIIQH